MYGKYELVVSEGDLQSMLLLNIYELHFLFESQQ